MPQYLTLPGQSEYHLTRVVLGTAGRVELQHFTNTGLQAVALDAEELQAFLEALPLDTLQAAIQAQSGAQPTHREALGWLAGNARPLGIVPRAPLHGEMPFGGAWCPAPMGAEITRVEADVTCPACLAIMRPPAQTEDDLPDIVIEDAPCDGL